jgi:glycosyltransferase involved in cell wall biosynthesis
MERHLTELILGLINRGHVVTVVSRSCELPPHRLLRWIRVPAPARPFTLAYPWFFAVGSLIAARVRRGVLHTTGAIVANRADVSTVHFCHHAAARTGGLTRESRADLLHRLNARVATRLSVLGERLCYRSRVTQRIVAVSPGVAGEMRRFFPAMRGQVEVIPNGVDLSRFARNPTARGALRKSIGASDADLVALFVGSEWQGKGLQHAIEGAAGTAASRLVVVGRGDQARYSRLAERLGASQRVHFTGLVADPAGWYSAADVFLLPTAYETFSLVTYEAAAAGLPLLATRVSGIVDVLRDGENGWFIEAAGHDIARRLNQLAADAGRRVEMGLMSRTLAAPYTWQAVVEAYVRVYMGDSGVANYPR